MDSGSSAGKSKNNEEFILIPVDPKKGIDSMDIDDRNGKQPVRPPTPEASREIGDFPVDLESPANFTLLKVHSGSLPVDLKITSGEKDQIACADQPKDLDINQFSPGSKDVIPNLNPNRFHKEANGADARRVDYASSFQCMGIDDGELPEEEILELVSQNILNVVLSNNRTGFVMFKIADDIDYDSEGWKTPPLVPISNPDADTCPGAPRRQDSPSECRSRDFEVEDFAIICKKLDFSV